jgi:flagellar basal body rod protein FlgG
MIYGLYLSATGVISSSHKQDVIANNLANAETAGFKRDVPQFQQRLSEAEQRRASATMSGWSDSNLDNIGGGLFVMPNAPDLSQGTMETTASPLDVAIDGEGYFAVQNRSGESSISLTRNGQFMVDRKGYLVLGTEEGQRVLDPNKQPIRLSPDAGGKISVSKDGGISQGTQPVGRIGVFTVDDKSKLTKQGGTLLAYSDPNGIKKIDTPVRGETIERSNVDPTTELTELMKTQRLLEANANMIRYQDQTLQRLVNDVGKIS